jgi:hypothetical protein
MPARKRPLPEAIVATLAGFLPCMQYISFRSARGMDFEHCSFKQPWKYVDFAFFASPMPGGRTGSGRALLFGCILG